MVRGRIFGYILVALILFAFQVQAQDLGPVYLIVDGEAVGNTVVFISGRDMNIGFFIRGGYGVLGVRVSSENTDLKRLLTHVLDKKYNRSDTDRKEETAIVVPPLEQFEESEVTFVLKFEDFDEEEKAVRKRVLFVKGEKEQPIEPTVIIADEVIRDQEIVDHVEEENPVEKPGELAIFINKEKEPQKLVLQPEQELEVRANFPAGIFIKRISVESESRALKEFLESILPERRGWVITNEQVVQKVTLPEKLPKGVYKTKVLIYYRDRHFEDKEYLYTFDITAEGSALVNMIADRAPEVFRARKFLQRIAREMGLEDLTAKDLEELGIDKEEFFKAMQELHKMKEGGATREEMMLSLRQRFRIPEVKKKLHQEKQMTLEYAMEKRKEVFKHLKKKKHALDVNISTLVYSFVMDDKELIKSKIILSIEGSNAEGGGELLVDIPKEVAAHVSDIAWGEHLPEVIEEDPVVKWAFQHIPQDEFKEYSFTVNKDVENFEILAASAADSPGLLARLIQWIIEKFQ